MVFLPKPCLESASHSSPIFCPQKRRVMHALHRGSFLSKHRNASPTSPSSHASGSPHAGEHHGRLLRLPRLHAAVDGAIVRVLVRVDPVLAHLVQQSHLHSSRAGRGTANQSKRVGGWVGTAGGGTAEENVGRWEGRACRRARRNKKGYETAAAEEERRRGQRPSRKRSCATRSKRGESDGSRVHTVHRPSRENILFVAQTTL